MGEQRSDDTGRGIGSHVTEDKDGTFGKTLISLLQVGKLMVWFHDRDFTPPYELKKHVKQMVGDF